MFLHRMNPTRVQFIQDKLVEIKRDEAVDDGESIQPGNVLKGLDVLDVGCGGGLLSEVCYCYRLLESVFNSFVEPCTAGCANRRD